MTIYNATRTPGVTQARIPSFPSLHYVTYLLYFLLWSCCCYNFVADKNVSVAAAAGVHQPKDDKFILLIRNQMLIKIDKT